MFVWKDSISEDNRVYLGILLSSGIAENWNNLSICVESESVLKLIVMCTSTMTDVPKRVQWWISAEAWDPMVEYHPKYKAFIAFWKSFSLMRGPILFICRDYTSFPRQFSCYRSFVRVRSTSEIVLFVSLYAPDRNYKKRRFACCANILQASEIQSLSPADHEFNF